MGVNDGETTGVVYELNDTECFSFFQKLPHLIGKLCVHHFIVLYVIPSQQTLYNSLFQTFSSSGAQQQPMTFFFSLDINR